MLSRRRAGDRGIFPAAGVRPSEKFAAEIAGRMEGPVLRHAQRLALFEVARRLGIGRFEANLIMAAVQHQRGQARAVAANAEVHRPWFAPLAVFVVIQGLIAWGAWLVFAA